jgi:putative transposase
MSTREIQAHLLEMYGAEVSPTLISSNTDAVNDETKLWQSRPLDPCYAIVYLDCLMLKVRDAGSVLPRALNLDGLQDVLSLWTAQNEGAKSWLAVITNLKNRGVADILIACVDGLMGFPETTGRPWAFEERLPTA